MVEYKTLSVDEIAYLRRYSKQMESATIYGYYTAIPSTEMLVLQRIYQRHIDPRWEIRLWCSHCCLTTLRGLHELKQRRRI